MRNIFPAYKFTCMYNKVSMFRLSKVSLRLFKRSHSFATSLSIPFCQSARSLGSFVARWWKGIVDATLISDRARDSNQEREMKPCIFAFRFYPLRKSFFHNLPSLFLNKIIRRFIKILSFYSHIISLLTTSHS